MRNKNQSSAASSMTSGLRSNEPSTAGGRELRLKARPPARFNSLRSERTVNQNKSHWVTPFWHNDTRSRVTVTFGAPRVIQERNGNTPTVSYTRGTDLSGSLEGA